ncbi:hypothetical protein P9112_000017 [Eukaryota sp. TZLM1-RC]
MQRTSSGFDIKLDVESAQNLPTIAPLPKGKAPDFPSSNPLIKLARLVGRAFYSHDPNVYIMLDALLRCGTVHDEELADVMQIPASILRENLNQLVSVRLVSKEEVKLPRGHGGKRSYYYIDWKQFVDTIRYKIAFIENKIDKELQGLKDDIQYECRGPDCGTTYTTLEVQRLINYQTFQFHCERCNYPLKERDSMKQTDKWRTLQQKVERELKPIKDLLDECHKIKISKEDRRNADKVMSQAEYTVLKQEASMGSRFGGRGSRRGGGGRRSGGASLNSTGGLKFNVLVLDGQGTPAIPTPAAPSMPSWTEQQGQERVEIEPSEGTSSSLSVPVHRTDHQSYLDEYVQKQSSLVNGSQGVALPADEEEEKVYVTVAGIRKLLSDVTEADEEKMTEEEHDKYFELMDNQ